MFNFTSDPQPKARAGRTLTAEDELSANVISLALAAHEESGAEKVIADLRKATESCDGYEHVGNKYTDIEALAAPKQGDEAVAYKLKADIEGAKIPMSFTVVRSGSTLIGFYSMNMLDADKAEVPDEILDAQVAKVEKVMRLSGPRHDEGPRETEVAGPFCVSTDVRAAPVPRSGAGGLRRWLGRWNQGRRSGAPGRAPGVDPGRSVADRSAS